MPEQDKKQHNNAKGFILIIISALFFSCQTVMGKLLIAGGLTGLNTTTLQFWFGVAAVLVINLVSGKYKNTIQESKGKKKTLAGIGVLSALTTGCVFMSLETLNAGIASMLLFTNPVFICLFFMITGIKKIGILNKVSVVIAMAGSVLALNIIGVSTSEIAISGILFGIGSGVFYAFYNIYYDLKLKEFSVLTAATFTQIVAALCITIVNFGIFTDFPDVSLKILALSAATSILTNLLPIFFLFKGIGYIGSEKASIIAVSELPFTLLVAFAFLGETLVGIQFVGIALVILAVILLQRE